LFQAVDALNHQDRNDKRRRPASSSSAALTSSKRNAAAAQSQVDIYQSLVECRILLQRCRLDHSAIDTADEQAQQQEVAQEQELCDKVLRNLIQARDQLNHRRQRQQQQNHDDDDDDDDEERNSNIDVISAHLQKAYAEDRVAWKEVLDRRHKDVRLHAGAVTSKQFRSLDASFFDQVEAAVEHEKTRFGLNRGNAEDAEEEDNGVDDSRLYQQILKDFVGSSSTQSSSAANGLPIRSSSSKKVNVDRKASKGRKVRYTEIPKLVHFTFPLSRPETDLETNAWFRSLFGGAVAAAASSSS
jgi:hypothetical protein